MEELIKLVSQRAGISEGQAKAAVETVLGFLKDKLPAPIAGQIDGLLNKSAGDLAQGLGGLLGRK
jgi:nucleoid DNA-binding protein